MADPLEHPRLRADLKVLHDQAASLLLYDPARRTLFELKAEDRAVLDLLDGRHPPQQIAQRTGLPLADLLAFLDDLADAFLLEDPEQEEWLAEERRRREEEDALLRPALDSRPTAGIVGRPVVLVDNARHTCRCCGDCCHYAVPVSPAEQQRLEGVDWPAEVWPAGLGRLTQVRPALQWGDLETVLLTRSDPTRCLFLDRQNRCWVHRRLGGPAKPFPCRLFPLAYPVALPDGVLFSLTFECPWIWETYETGEPLGGLSGLLAEMEEVYELPAEVPLDGERTVGQAEYLAWEEGWLAHPTLAAGDIRAFLEDLRRRWESSWGWPAPVPAAEELAATAGHLARSVRQNRSLLSDSPEGDEGVGWAGRVLEALAGEPEAAWRPLAWVDGPAADRFLDRFLRQFIGGKQALRYPSLWPGLRAASLLLLFSRWDAALLAREAGAAGISLALLNRALARWCRLFEIPALRLALLQGG